MNIENSNSHDTKQILSLYDSAVKFQKEKNGIPWATIENELIEAEIKENRQWKLVNKNEIACVWLTTFNDSEIWEKKNSEPSVYIHRIATNPTFRGQKMVSKIIDWAKEFAIKNGKKYIRLDTAGINPGLITMYIRNGFKFISIKEMGESSKLPAHYHNASICLFEMAVE